MNFWMVMKWNELVTDYNVIKSNNEGKEMNLKTMLDKYENDTNIFYSHFEDQFSQNRNRVILEYNN